MCFFTKDKWDFAADKKICAVVSTDRRGSASSSGPGDLWKVYSVLPPESRPTPKRGFMQPRLPEIAALVR